MDEKPFQIINEIYLVDKKFVIVITSSVNELNFAVNESLCKRTSAKCMLDFVDDNAVASVFSDPVKLIKLETVLRFSPGI